MNLLVCFDELIVCWSLFDSKFYQVWSVGILLVSALWTYVVEYGVFILLIFDGWEGYGDKTMVVVEREHFGMWCRFVQVFDIEVGNVKTLGVWQFCDIVRCLFGEKVFFFGVFYVFEV